MKFTRFAPTPVPVDINDPLYTGVLEQNFSDIERSLGYIGQDLTSFTSQYLTLTAATALTAGQLCYLDTSGTMSLADASAESTSKSLLGIATTAISSGATGKFLIKGIYDTTGLTTGSLLYVSTTAGEMVGSPPGSSGEIIRILGYALSTTQLFFEPDRTWTEIA